MADRTWNGIDGRLFDEFDAPTAVLLSILIARCPNDHGVYDLPLAYLKRFIKQLQEELADKTPDEIVASGLGTLSDEHKISIYSDNALWITGKFKRSRYSTVPNNQTGALRSIAEHHPLVLCDFATKYGLSTDLVQLSTHPVPTEGGTKLPVAPTTDPDPDPEKKDNTSAPNPPDSPTRKSKPKVSNTIKAKPLYDETIKRFPPECEVARESFESMCAGTNASGEMSKTKLAGILAEILERTKELTPEQINYGLFAAIKNGAPNANYVFKAARGYEEPSDDDFFSPGRNGNRGMLEYAEEMGN